MTLSPAPELGEGAIATDVRCDDRSLHVILADGRELSVPLAWFPGLLRATPDQRDNWRLIGGGQGIHWADVDEDLSVAGLLRGERPAER